MNFPSVLRFEQYEPIELPKFNGFPFEFYKNESFLPCGGLVESFWFEKKSIEVEPGLIFPVQFIIEACLMKDGFTSWSGIPLSEQSRFDYIRIPSNEVHEWRMKFRTDGDFPPFKF